jgi:hypothetical protein
LPLAARDTCGTRGDPVMATDVVEGDLADGAGIVGVEAFEAGLGLGLAFLLGQCEVLRHRRDQVDGRPHRKSRGIGVDPA